MSYSSNISEVISLKIAEMEAIEKDRILRAAALAVLPEMKKRVHVDGKASDGTQIGTYSNAYLKLRTGNYANADKFKKGKNAGKNKNSGTFTDRAIRLNKNVGVFTGEEKVGTARPNFNRTSDPKVILSLTRQMENDLSIIALPDGYGIGYNNPENYKKSQWNEETYKKPIWNLTSNERELAITVANEEFDNQQKV